MPRFLPRTLELAARLLLSLLLLAGVARADSRVRNIPVGSNPNVITVNPITNRIYVGNSGSNSISVIEGETNTAIETVPTPLPVAAMVLNPKTNRIYVLCRNANGANALYLLDGGTDNLTLVPDAGQALSVAVDIGVDEVYVGERQTNELRVLRGDGSLLQSNAIAVAPDFLAVNTVTRKLYLASGSGALSVLGRATLTETPLPNAASSYDGIVVNPATNRIYARGKNTNNVAIIDGATDAETVSATFPDTAEPGFALNPITNKIYSVAGPSASNLVALDAATNAVFPVQITGTPGGLGINTLTNKIYVSLRAGLVTIVDGATNAATNVSVGKIPGPIGVNPITNRIYVVNPGGDYVTVIDGSSYTAQPLVGGFTTANRTAVDGGRNEFFVATPLGVLKVEEASHDVALLGFGAPAATVAVNASTHKVYAPDPDGQTLLIHHLQGAFASSIVLQEASDQIAIDESANRVYLTGLDANGETKLEIVDGDFDFSLQTAVFPAGVTVYSLVVNPRNHKAYFATSAGLYRYGPTLEGDPVYIGEAGDAVPRSPGPQKLAVNPISNRVYFALPGDPGQPAPLNLGSVRGYDSDTDIISSRLLGPAGIEQVAVDSQANLTYTLNPVTQTLTITDVATNTLTVTNLDQTPVDIAVDEVHRRAYVLSSLGVVNTFDSGSPSGSFNALYYDVTLPIANSLSVNPNSGELIASSVNSGVSLISGTPPAQSAVATFITPVFNDSITFSPLDSAVHLQAVSLFGPNRTAVQQIYYQIDHVDQQWTPAFLDGTDYSGDLSELSIGRHTVYAFATDAQVDGTATSTQGSSPLLGQISSYSFQVRPGSFFFSESAVTVIDNTPKVTLTVLRDFEAPSSVDYQTEAHSALPGVNYVDTHGTLNFALGETSKTIEIPILNRDFGPPSVLFHVTLSTLDPRATTSGSAQVTLRDDHSPDLALSLLTSVQPSRAPDASSSIQITLTPPEAGGQWRLFGELDWRGSGTTASGLVSGNYLIEFKTVAGFAIPDGLTVPLDNSQAATRTADYAPIDPDAPPVPGLLQVQLLPSGMGGWRLQGELDFRHMGDPPASQPPGDYILEFEPVADRATPSRRVVRIVSATQTNVTATYLLPDAGAGSPATPVLGFLARIVPPYEFIGQIQTDAGFGTGFVPLDRIVVTAAHVLFDDGTLTYEQGVRWFFQHETGAFETPPQIPRGTYLFEGYAAQRAIDNLPGTSSNASQQLDAAVMYFLEPTARGGASGYLASNSATNPWLTGTLAKEISGYPVEQIPLGDVGKLHSTPSFTAGLEFVSGAVFRTTAVHTFHGSSGGPLSVRLPSGESFPAAIYLGGTAQTVVRAFDTQIVDLMNRAQISGSGGANNVGGGITQVNNGLSGTTQFALGSLKMELRPPGAVAAAARWRLSNQSTLRVSKQSALGLAPGSYLVVFSSVPGYDTPNAQFVLVSGGGIESTAVATYIPTSPPSITSPATATAIIGQPFRYQITGTFDPSSFTADNLPDGLTVNSSSGLISGTPTTEGELDVTLTAMNGRPGAVPRNLHLIVARPGALTISVVGQGSLPRGFLGDSVRAAGSTLSVKATPKTGFLFDHWSDADSGAVLSTSPVYRFTVLPRQHLEVTFVPNLFLAGKGTYAGLLQGGRFELSGMLTLTLAKNGGFTAKITLGRGSATVKNSFGSGGHFDRSINLSDGRLFQLALDLGSAGVITGSFTELATQGQYPFAASRTAHAAKTVVGSYTARLPLAPDSDLDPALVIPGGTGFGRAVIKSAGTVVVTGRLGDGTPFSAASHLDSTGAWPFYALPGGNQIVLGGLSPTLGTPGFRGNLGWYRLPATADPAYPDGFSLQLDASLVSFRPPALAFRDTRLSFTSPAGLPLLTEDVTLSPKGAGATSDAFSLRIKVPPATGLFSGTFTDTSSITHNFFGAVLQDTATGTGLYLDAAGLTGTLLLQPIP